MKKTTLLQKAKEVKGGRNKFPKVSDEEIEIAVAWMKSEITFTQLKGVINKKGSNLYNFLATRLKEAHRRGKIK